MRVLMFGWEFPPHISGGLGTACHGLTLALRDHADILFVVPKSSGEEDIDVIDASNVWIADEEDQEHIVASEVNAGRFVTIAAGEGLLPYVDTATTARDFQWNWEHRSSDVSDPFPAREKRFSFSGGYGTNLLFEVEQYAAVARSIASAYTFDVIHAHDWLTYPAATAAKSITGKPMIVHVHSTVFDRAGDAEIDPMVFEIELAGMLAADRIIAVSNWTKGLVVSRYGIADEKVSVVHNGVIPQDVAGFSFIPKVGEFVVTFLGRITSQKGPAYFIEAARRVVEQFPGAHFILAGSGDLLPAMIERVATLGLSSRIHFTGFVRGAQVRQLWSVTDVYVMPSLSEPFGITPLEAMQSGIPVIVSNQSGVSEVIEHAIKVDFWNTDALASAIINILTYRGLSDVLRSNSKREVESITWTRSAKKINSLYHEVTA